jgi:uncharacterized coiled-coil protein SlyX
MADGDALRRTSGLPGLLDRVVHLRRRKEEDADPRDPGAADTVAPATDTPAAYPVRIEELEERIADLETLVEGLQDSVHRESVRREHQISRLETKTEPSEINRALSREARERGI